MKSDWCSAADFVADGVCEVLESFWLAFLICFFVVFWKVFEGALFQLAPRILFSESCAAPKSGGGGLMVCAADFAAVCEGIVKNR